MKKLITLLIALVFIMPELFGELVTVSLDDGTKSKNIFENQNSYYTYYTNQNVQADCKYGNISTWTESKNFKSNCEAFSIPFNEDFTEVTYGSLPDCWSVIGEGPDNWWVQDSDEAGGIVPEMQFNSWPEIDGTSRLITPSISTGGAGKFIISFRQYLYDENDFTGEYIAVEYSIDDGNSWEEIWHYDCYASMAPTLTEVVFEIPSKSDEFLIAFKFNGNSYNIYYWYIDNIVIEVAPTCIRPTALTVSDINQTSAIISWTPRSGETAWNLKYGPLGFDPDTQGNSVDAFVINSCTISGLNSNILYDVYVRAVCDEEDVSAWSVKKTFRTLCDPVNLPYIENFDNVTTPDIPDCMTVTDKYGFGIWATWHTIDWLSRSEPNSMAIFHNFSLPLDEWFFTPGLNLTGGNTYIVEFYYLVNYEISSSEELEVKWGTAPNVDGMTSERIWYDEDFMGEDYVLATAVFTPEEDGVYFVGWHASSDINYGLSIYVDDIFIDLAPTCPKPTALTVSDITANSAKIDWTKGGNETMWNLKYYKVGIGDTVFINNIEKPYTCTDLTPGTNYAFMVQADCGDGDVSMWSVIKTFVTLCEAISDLPWTESFENVTIPDLPVCWLNESGMWHTANNDNSPYDANARTGEQFLREYFWATNSYIWTPGFAIQAGKTYEFSFWWAGDGYSNWKGDVFLNHFQTSEDATHIANFVQPGTYTTKVYAQFLYSFVPESDDIYYFAIRISSSWPAMLISFDDFEFKVIQTGPVPTLPVNGPQLSGCYDALELITITNAQVKEGIDVEYRAGVTINATGFTVEANAAAYLYAGENIVLGGGILVAQGADFLATIMDPVTYCEQTATMVTAKSEEAVPAIITPAEIDAMFTIFPNPTTGRFTLMMKEADDASVINVEIFGLMGERVLQTQLFGQNQYEFDLSDSPKGVYIVRVLSGKQTSIGKLIKQ